AATRTVEARRAPVIGHVLELAQVAIETAKLVLVVGQRILSLNQLADRGLRLIPDIGRRGHRVLQHVSYCCNWVWYCSICLSVCATDSMAVMTFCVRLPASMTGM